jgi:mitochondrial fission protein ELM1
MMPSVDEILENMDVWVLSDGKIGHVNQSLGVAEALNISPKLIELKEKPYAKILGRINGSWAVENDFSAPWPDMVIATGTLPAFVSGWIKTQNPETITLQMMTPPCRKGLYDIIASPLHDGLQRRDNVINTIGSPNRITKERLEEAKEKWSGDFSKLKEPLAVIIGGSNKYFTFDEQKAENFVMEVVSFAQKNGFHSLLVTASRRTGEKQIEAIQRVFQESGLDIYFWDGEGDNPYFGYLAWAKAAVVTADSIAMVSESCTAGLPVCVYGIEHIKSSKFARFFKALLSQKMIHPFSLNKIDFTAPAHALSDTQMVAGAIHAVILRNNLVG